MESGVGAEAPLACKAAHVLLCDLARTQPRPIARPDGLHLPRGQLGGSL